MFVWKEVSADGPFVMEKRFNGSLTGER